MILSLSVKLLKFDLLCGRLYGFLQISVRMREFSSVICLKMISSRYKSIQITFNVYVL